MENSKLGSSCIGSFFLKGVKAVLVNLNNHCEMQEFQENGIFIEDGDIVIITG